MQHQMQTRYRPPSDSVFTRRTQKEHLVTPQILAAAKPFSHKIIRMQQNKLEKHFSRYATRKYHCKPQQVKFDSANQLQRMLCATLKKLDHDTLGETDGNQIWISSSTPMTFDDVVCVLVHEYLHNFCRVRGRFMSCYNEHQCMRGLGDCCVG